MAAPGRAVFGSSQNIVRTTQPRGEVARSFVVFSWTRQNLTSLFSVLFPSDCHICGEPLFELSRLPVCRECLAAMHPIGEKVCSVCGERLFSSYAFERAAREPRCGMCLRIAPMFARAVAYGSYEAGLREMIHLLKFEGVRPAAAVLGRMLAEAISKLGAAVPSSETVLIPVPLHRIKRRQRGFNQAELIARAALKNLAEPPRFRLCPRALERKRETTSQVGLTSHQRRANLRGAFVVAEPQSVKDKEVLLVDDVYTTGATVSECARVLLRAGASKVYVATVARTLKTSAQHLEVFGPRGQKEILPAETPLARAVGM